MNLDTSLVYLQPAYVLHARPYRDTSLIVDVLTAEHGRVTAVARGARKSKKQGRQLLSPFHRLLVNWQGKSTLKLITGFETDHHFLHLEGNFLYSGFYLNELLVRLLPEHDLVAGLFEQYEATLYAFHLKRDIEPMLREFERELLKGLGYAISYEQDCLSGEAIKPDSVYCLSLQQGFYQAPPDTPVELSIPGKIIQSLANREYECPEVRRLAKNINRTLLRSLLGKKPLKSRELFRQAKPAQP